MDRNHNILKFAFISVATIATLMNCLGKNDEEYILDLPNYTPTFDEAIGKYYFVPIQEDNYRDDYKYFKLKKGDTLFLEIKKDSTFFFNIFYFNQGERVDSLTRKLKVGEDNTIVSIGPPSSSYVEKNATIYLSGFKKSHKTGLYYYYGINSPTDATEFEYYIVYKKIK
ncbi:MAG: hypothetical protein LBE36_01655 [Flavobacteriaceae bacterium]|jgi:hypothetical protein|nr:hypothetical protein [Flavobacteriaceae bacterium]